MASYYDKLHSQGIRVEVNDCRSQGPYVATVSCGVTGQYLGGATQCKTVENAIEAGKRIARKNTY